LLIIKTQPTRVLQRNVEIFIDKAVVLVFNNIVVNQSRDISGSGGGAVDTLPLRA
jgi:hypothetical protein